MNTDRQVASPRVPFVRAPAAVGTVLASPRLLPTPKTHIIRIGLPKTMRAISSRIGGSAGSMILEERTVPTPKPGEVLIKVAAAGVNRGDILQRERNYPAPTGTEYDVLGLEVSGTIVAINDSSGTFRIGDKVCALMKSGGYAEYALAEVNMTLPVPKGVSLMQAASLPEPYFTVWANVFQRGQLKTGQNFLVHGGTSGVGATAIQLAKAFGAQVFTTAGSADKCRACLDLGADVAIQYHDRGFVTEVRNWTGDTGVDLILDMVAGSYLQRNLDALALDGMVVMIGLMEGMETKFNIGKLLSRRLTIAESTLWAQNSQQKAEARRGLLTQVWPMFTHGALRPIANTIYPLGQAAKAHTEIETNRDIGKPLLCMKAA